MARSITMTEFEEAEAVLTGNANAFLATWIDVADLPVIDASAYAEPIAEPKPKVKATPKARRKTARH
ncbi:MAG TPA: hypothetical protein VEH27_05605 [Methylomirabilota bacterium]|nr:hypothetical protein [Methylomirabilota bacterium]